MFYKTYTIFMYKAYPFLRLKSLDFIRWYTYARFFILKLLINFNERLYLLFLLIFILWIASIFTRMSIKVKSDLTFYQKVKQYI